MMSINFVIDKENIKSNILQKEYKTLTLILKKLQKVVIRNENILSYSKTQTMKLLNDLVKKMNETYNKSIVDIFENSTQEQGSQAVKNESLYGDISEFKNDISSSVSENSLSKISDTKTKNKKNKHKLQSDYLQMIKNKTNSSISKSQSVKSGIKTREQIVKTNNLSVLEINHQTIENLKEVYDGSFQ
jgi:hypothetical protein